MEQEKKNKKCTKCGRELPLTEFYRNKATKDGLTYCCKECCSKKSADWYKKITRGDYGKVFK